MFTDKTAGECGFTDVSTILILITGNNNKSQQNYDTDDTLSIFIYLCVVSTDNQCTLVHTTIACHDVIADTFSVFFCTDHPSIDDKRHSASPIDFDCITHARSRFIRSASLPDKMCYRRSKTHLF